jgi:hypothetical protein
MTATHAAELPWMASLRERAERYQAIRDACRCSTARGIGPCRCGAVDQHPSTASRPERALL